LYIDRFLYYYWQWCDCLIAGRHNDFSVDQIGGQVRTAERSGEHEGYCAGRTRIGICRISKRLWRITNLVSLLRILSPPLTLLTVAWISCSKALLRLDYPLTPGCFVRYPSRTKSSADPWALFCHWDGVCHDKLLRQSTIDFLPSFFILADALIFVDSHRRYSIKYCMQYRI